MYQKYCSKVLRHSKDDDDDDEIMKLYIKEEFTKQITQFKNCSQELLTAEAPMQILGRGTDELNERDEVSLITAQFEDGPDTPAKSRMHSELKKIILNQVDTPKRPEKNKKGTFPNEEEKV